MRHGTEKKWEGSISGELSDPPPRRPSNHPLPHPQPTIFAHLQFRLRNHATRSTWRYTFEHREKQNEHRKIHMKDRAIQDLLVSWQDVPELLPFLHLPRQNFLLLCFPCCLAFLSTERVCSDAFLFTQRSSAAVRASSPSCAAGRIQILEINSWKQERREYRRSRVEPTDGRDERMERHMDEGGRKDG